MSKLRLEIGENVTHQQCDCCAKESCNAHGFVFEDEVPKAVYYAGWSAAHPERGVTTAIGVGKWDEQSSPADRVCFGLVATETADQIIFSFIDPQASPWRNNKLLGSMLNRQEALDHPESKVALAIAEEIVRNHPAIQKFLHVQPDMGTRPAKN